MRERRFGDLGVETDVFLVWFKNPMLAPRNGFVVRTKDRLGNGGRWDVWWSRS